MLMNPQYSPAYYTDMYRGPGHTYHPSLSSHQSSFNESAVSDFYGGLSSANSSCYNPSPTPLETSAAVNLDTHGRQEPVFSAYHGYSCNLPQSVDHSMTMYSTPPNPWHASHGGTGHDDKRGPVIMGQAPAQPPVKRKGGRKPKDDPNLPPQEKEKRRLRRLRNKEAAAKCRERRLNHTSGLLQQIEQMEKEQRSYEDQISALRDHKLKFEQLLESHRRDCDKKFSMAVCGSAINSPNPAAVPAVSLGSHSNCSTPNSTTSSLSLPSHPTTTSRRKQTNPKLSLDTSCATSHRLSSSSSGSEMLSPMILP